METKFSALFLFSILIMGIASFPGYSVDSSLLAFADDSAVTITTSDDSGFNQDCGDKCYSPDIAKIDVGGVVTFDNPVGFHTFTAGTVDGFTLNPSGEFDITLAEGESSTWIPDTPGEIPYYCALHAWMTGVIIVQEADAEEVNDDDSEDRPDDSEDNNSDTQKEINDATREIQRAEEKISNAADAGKDTELSVQKLNKAKELLVLANSHFDAGDFNEAEELAEEAKDLAAESRMKYLGKSTEDFDDNKQSKQDRTLEKQTKAEKKRIEKQAKAAEKLIKAQERLAEKLVELEEKLTEKAQLSEERANKILEKITKETQKHDKRVQKLIDKFQNGEYFGSIKNTDKEIQSFVMTFDGTAAEIGQQSNIETLTGELFLENHLTGSNSKKFKITGGEIFVGESEVFDIIFGKSRLSSSGSGGEKDSMIIIAQVSDGVDVRTLKLSIDLSEEFDSETESTEIEVLFPRSKIASLWFLSASGKLGLTESEPIVDTPEDVPPVLDDTIPDEIPETVTLTVLTTESSYVSGNEIMISGTVGEIIDDLPVVLQITTSTDLVGIAQIIPESDGTFEHSILADGPLWLVDDTITIKAFYGGNNMVETSFEFSLQ